METRDGGKLTILVLCDKPDFQSELESAAQGSHLNLLFSPTVESARTKTVSNDVGTVAQINFW